MITKLERTLTTVGLKLRVPNRKTIFSFLKQNMMLWVLKRTVSTLMSTQNICKKLGVRKYLQFYAETFCLSKSVYCITKQGQNTKLSQTMNHQQQQQNYHLRRDNSLDYFLSIHITKKSKRRLSPNFFLSLP